MRKTISRTALVLAILCGNAGVQAEPIYIEPLFEYAQAPEELETLTERSEYVVAHFWDKMDFSRKTTVDQNALGGAFNVWSSAMPFCDRAVVMKSVDGVIRNLKGNPVLTLQFAKAAEESLYGPRASIWSDEVYLPFLKAVVSDKGISEARKLRYSEQMRKLTATAPGKKAPAFRYRMSNGNYRDFKADSEYTIIEFGDPDCDDCRFARIKLEMAGDLADLIEDKRVKMLFIVPDVTPDEESEMLGKLKSYPESWITGVGYGIDDSYDFRMTPCFYLLGPKGEIIIKNRDVSSTLEELRSQIQTTRK